MVDGAGVKWVWWAYAGVGGVLLAAYPLLPQGAQQASYDLISASVVAALVVGIRRHRPRPRLPWVLFTAGQAFYTAGDVAWNLVNARYGSVPTPSAIDGLYMAFYPLVAVGLWILVRRRSRDLRRSGMVIDALVTASAVGMVTWLLIRPSMVDSTASVAATLVNLFYPLGDLVLLVLALRLALSGGRRSGALRLLVLSLVLTTAADLGYLVISARSDFDGGSVTDLLWLAGYVAFGAAALHRSMTGLSDPVPAAAARLSRGRVVLLGAAMLVAPVAPALAAVSGHAVDLIAFVTGAAVLYLLVLARIVGVVRQHERALRREQVLRARSRRRARRFHAIVDASSDIVILVDAEGIITWCAPSVQRLSGYLPADLIGRSANDFAHPEDTATVASLVGAIAESDTSAHVDCRLRMHDGSYRVFQVTAQNLLADPDVAAVVLTGLDVTERRRLSDELRRRVFHDELTGLASRALFTDRLHHALLRRADPAGEVAVIFVDLDDFRTVKWPSGSSPSWPPRSTSTGTTCSWRPASASPRAGTAPPIPTCCSATPTSPCTRPSRPARTATRCTGPACTPPRSRAWNCRPTCNAPWNATSSSCTTSRCPTCVPASWSASRRCCAGSTRNAAW
ncbi:MAG: hypothetical protein AUI10_05995 [Actinobacteria bacterium 13_2_20CM_2_72_6]|nr:MAG: hypothetical protein AUI10_05995 [Actinobacteria bacterium 13_2_20CM_2_72_6]